MVLPLWKIHQFLKTLKTELPCDSEMSLLGIHSKKTETKALKTFTQTHVHSSITHESRKAEATQVSMNE